MKRLYIGLIVTVGTMILCLLILAVMLKPPEIAAGTLRIGDICMEVYTTHGDACDCCAPLWGGGIAVTDADLSGVQEGDWATITLLDGTRLVMECAAITPCLRVGNCLIGPWGITRAEGEIIIYDKCTAWWFVRL